MTKACETCPHNIPELTAKINNREKELPYAFGNKETALKVELQVLRRTATRVFPKACKNCPYLD